MLCQLLLHNPEFFLTEQLMLGVPLAAAREEFYERLTSSFAAMEEMIDCGQLGSCYGV